ncbi:MAG: AI-2E family transporter [Rhodospirillales bacterium]|nr:AI-2E family transporter [Alphaproteobacteria bacterium]MCB9986329.1 AI-2E family transporter [Rhodospirillales bacterium]USO07121.1 MAG: AI-2E family transporter [Rhodospirillales bacterium]
MLAARAGTIWFWGAVVALFIGFVWLFQGILPPFILGLVIAYLLNPALTRLVNRGWPRWAAVLVLLLAFLLAFGLLIGLSIPLMAREASQLASALPGWIDYAHNWLVDTGRRYGFDFSLPDTAGGIVGNLQDHAGRILGAGKGVAAGLIAGGAALFDFASFVVLMPVVAFYMMLDWPRLVSAVDGLVPREGAMTVRELVAEINRRLAGFVRGQLTVCLILGLFYGVGLTLIGINFGFVIGLFAGLLTIMPFVGSIFGLVASLAVAWFTTGDMTAVVAALVVFALGQFLEGHVLTPRLVGGNVGLHPLWIIFALMAGASLAGFVGLLIAVPVAAVAGVMVRFVLSQYKKSGYYAG